MMRLRRMYLFSALFFFVLSFSIFVQGKALAEIEKDKPVKTGNVISSKTVAPTHAVIPSEAESKAEKQQDIRKTPSKADKRQEVVQNAPLGESVDNKHEEEQDIMEKALELLNNSHEYWAKGEVEDALEALDQAYAILLDTNGDPDIARQKDDLRLLISKKILAIYTAKHSVTSGQRSEIPMIMNSFVEREIRSFQTVERDFFIQSYQRSLYFRPVIVEALKRAGLPEELSWLPLVESGFKIRALSRARALGLWQFIPSTGYKYGLNRDDWVDERMDVEKSTQSAIGYLKDLHGMFGDWLTDLAAYNCGEGRVLRVISRQHINYLDRFWDLYGQLPNETARYVPRFLATLHIIKNPQKYGMNLDGPAEKQPPYAYDIVKTNKIMNLKDVASRLDVPEEQLCTLNAELRHDKTPDKDYNLKIPQNSADKFAQIQGDIPQADKPGASDQRRTDTVKHRVKAGETVASIARKYRISTTAIKKQNHSLAKGGLRVGQNLVIAQRGSSGGVKDNEDRGNNGRPKAANTRISYKVKKGDTLLSLAGRFNISVDEIKRVNHIKGSTLKMNQVLKFDKIDYGEGSGKKKGDDRAATGSSKAEKINKPGTDSRDEPKTYVVKKGDNLMRIAERSGNNVAKIMKLNNMRDKDSLQAGRVIVLR